MPTCARMNAAPNGAAFFVWDLVRSDCHMGSRGCPRHTTRSSTASPPRSRRRRAAILKGSARFSIPSFGPEADLKGPKFGSRAMMRWRPLLGSRAILSRCGLSRRSRWMGRLLWPGSAALGRGVSFAKRSRFCTRMTNGASSLRPSMPISRGSCLSVPVDSTRAWG
jgi:hypothetical protein